MKRKLIATRFMRVKEKICVVEGFDDVSGRCLSVFCPWDKFYSFGFEEDALEYKKWYSLVFEGIEFEFRYYKDRNDEKKFFAWVVD